MAKLKSRQIASGIVEEEKKPYHAPKEAPKKSSDFNERRKNLEAFFQKQGGSTEEEVPIKKEEIHGNA